MSKAIQNIVEQIRKLLPNKTESFSVQVNESQGTLRLAMEVSIEDKVDLIDDLNYDPIDAYYTIALTLVDNSTGHVTDMGTIHADQFFNLTGVDIQGMNVEISSVVSEIMDVLNKASN